MSVRFDMRMDEELRGRLERYCEVTGQSMSEAVSRMLGRCLDEHERALAQGRVEAFPRVRDRGSS